MSRQVCSQHPIDKTWRAVAPVQLGKLDRLVDRDLDRNVPQVFQLKERQPQDIAVNNRQLVNGVLGRELGNQLVQLWLVLLNASYQQLDKLLSLWRKGFPVGGKVFFLCILESTRQGSLYGMTDRVHLEQYLKRQCASSTT